MGNSSSAMMGEIIEHCEKLSLVNEEVKEIVSILDGFSSISSNDKKNIIIHLVEDFGKKKRKDGTPYVNHLRHTLLNTIAQDGNNISRTALLVSILHDSIEDTKLTFEKIRDIFGLEVAVCVGFLSKKAFWKFIGTVSDISEEESTIHHDQLGTIFQLLRDQGITHEYQINEEDIPQEITEFWKTLKAPYKKTQQDEYFQKFGSRENIKKGLELELEKKNISFSDTVVSELVNIIITVKLSDRLHNLGTLTEKHQKKISETLYYLKELIREIIDTPLGRKLSTEISWLRHQYDNESLEYTG